jgi:AhpD family alkylhydroperoxidase
MATDRISKFINERERLQSQLQDFGDLNLKRFLGIDNKVYENGALDTRTKEMLGFVASLVLRCDDCINYHIANLKKIGVTDAEFKEILSVGMIAGGSITIPHARRAVDAWLEYRPETDESTK